jgi:hypothetical protein
MFRLPLALALLAALAVPTLGQTITAVEVDTSKPGQYLVNVDAQGNVTMRPMRLIRLGNQPDEPDPPDNPNTPFEQEIAKLATASIASGGSKTTAVGIASVYSLVADAVDKGDVGLDQWPELVKMATDAVLNKQEDGARWVKFRTDVGGALTLLRAQGALDSKAEVVGVLKSISTGLNRAAGITNWNLQEVAGLDRAGRDRWDMADKKADGILDGIDLAQIIALVKLIMELLKLFGGGN